MHKTSVVFVVSVLFGVGLIYGYTMNRPSAAPQKPANQQQKNDKRRDASRLVFKGLHNPHTEKIEDIAAIAKGDVRVEREVGLPLLTPNSTFDFLRFVSNRACDADAIVIGKVLRSGSKLTEDGSFIYTSYEFKVEEVVKDNLEKPINYREPLIILRTGGEIALSGKRIVAEDKSAKPLESGERYLLFVTYLPERSAYAADNLAYKLKNEKIIKLTEQVLDPALETGNEADPFIDRVRSAVNIPCTSAGGGR